MAGTEAIAGYEALGPLRPGAALQRARELRTGRPCALRRMPAPAGEAEERFQAECERILAFSHPHLAQVYDAGTSAGTAWVAQELVEGVTLQEVLEGLHRPLPAAAALGVAAQLAEALAALDAADLLHLDLSPENVILTPEGWVKLTGLGVGLAGDVTCRLTSGGAAFAAVDFLAPELIEGELDPTSKADVYALGALLYRSLAGRTPFSGATLFDRLRAVVHDAPAPLGEVQPEAPAAAADLVAVLMEWDRDDRPLSADLPELVERTAARCGVEGADWELTFVAGLVREWSSRPRTDPTPSRPGERKVLVRLRGKLRTFEVPLGPGESFIVGRSGDVAVTLPFPWMSRRHARIERTSEGVLLTDLGSANGTFFNREKIDRPVLVSRRDRVAFGNMGKRESRFLVSFRLSEADAPPERCCRLCEQEVSTDDDGVCAPCRQAAEAARDVGERRVRGVLEDLQFSIHSRLSGRGVLQRYRVIRGDERWLISAGELGQRSAEAFLEASQKALAVSHPAILPVRTILARGGVLLVLNEAHAGPTLEEQVRAQGPMPASVAVRLGQVLADALDGALQAGVGALLVRPDLVLLDPELRPALLDVGLAPGLLEVQRSHVELASRRPCYEAPEVSDVRETTERAAVYALGATLGFALTGSPAAELRGRERYDHPPLTMIEGVPRRIAFLLACATSPEPQERPPSLAAVRDTLAALADEELETNPGLTSSDLDYVHEDEATQQVELRDLPPELREG